MTTNTVPINSSFRYTSSSKNPFLITFLEDVSLHGRSDDILQHRLKIRIPMDCIHGIPHFGFWAALFRVSFLGLRTCIFFCFGYLLITPFGLHSFDRERRRKKIWKKRTYMIITHSLACCEVWGDDTFIIVFWIGTWGDWRWNTFFFVSFWHSHNCHIRGWKDWIVAQMVEWINSTLWMHGWNKTSHILTFGD